MHASVTLKAILTGAYTASRFNHSSKVYRKGARQKNSSLPFRFGVGLALGLPHPTKTIPVTETMLHAGKAVTIAWEMECYNLTVLGLAETRWTKSVETKLTNGQSII